MGGDFTDVSGQTRYFIAAVDTSGNVTGWNPQADNRVQALVVSGSTVYAGGYFVNIGDASRNAVAALDIDTGLSTSWNPSPTYGSRVNAISIPNGTSTVYISGNFTDVGNTSRSYLAAITPEGQLTDWAPQPNGEVYALGFSGSTLYIGGNFGYVDAVARNNIAALNIDSVSSPVVSEWNPNADAYVTSMAVSGASVYFGGNFTSVGGQERQHVAAVHTANGTLLGWDPNSSDIIYSISPDNSKVYIGGSANSIGGKVRNHAASINTITGEVTSWNPNVDSSVEAISAASSTIYIGGSFGSVGGQNRNNIAAVNNSDGAVTSWNPNADNEVNALTIFGNTVYAGGYFTNIGGKNRAYLAALDMNTDTDQATSWNPNPDDQVRVFAIKDSTLYVGGRFRHFGTQTRSALGAFDLNTGNLTSYIGNVSYNSGTPRINAMAISGNTIYVGGQFNYVGTGAALRYSLAAIDLTTGVATSWDPYPYGNVNALNVYGNTVYVAGNFWHIGGQDRNYLAAINATDGTATDWNPNPDNTVMTLSRKGTSLYAGGYFNNIELLHLYLASFTIQDVEFSSLTGSGREDAGTITIPVEINTPLPEDATVNYSITGGTATNGVNYSLPSGTATILAGATSTNISLSLIVDHAFTGDQTFEITLSNPSDNIRLGANKKFTYTIHDSDFVGYESHDVAVTPSNPGAETSAASTLSTVQDSTYWTTALSTTDGGYDSQVFKFKPDLTGITNPSFSIDWIGHGDVPEDKLVHLSIWNNNTSSWEELSSQHCSDDCTLSGIKVGTDYRDSNGFVWVWAKADNQAGAPFITDLTDNNNMLPITWSTGDINANSEVAYDQVSHPGSGTSTWDSYASHIVDNNQVTSHYMTPALPNNSTRNWSDVAYSTSSNVMFAAVNGGSIFKSTDHGATLTDVTSAGSRSWNHITVSGDGTKVAAFDTSSGLIYYSVNSGSTWATSSAPGNDGPQSLKYSPDGSHLFFATYQNVYISTDNGLNWTSSTDTFTPGYWWSNVTSSYDGSTVYAISSSDGISQGSLYVSTTTGATWTRNGFSTGNYWNNFISTSQDGSVVVVSSNYGSIYISPDSGATWNVQNDPGSRWWYGASISQDGTHIVAIDNNFGYLYTGVSSDLGQTWSWTTHTTPFNGQYWESAAISNDGTHMAAVAYNSDLYTSDDSGTTWIDRTGTVWYYRVRSVTSDGDATTSEERSLIYNLNSSCPFIFTYDGSKYNFIIDASSAATLGSGGDLDLWKANPFYKSTSYPNPLSFVKIPHGSLVPRTVNGENFYDVKTTFELNETNYYDQAALKVIDHNPNIDVYPDYRNTDVIHTISNTATAPVSVIDTHGQDVKSLVASNDNVYWHSSPTDLPAYLTIKLANGSTTPSHLKLLIKRGKHGNQTGGQGSDKIQYKNSSGVFVNVPAQYDPFNSKRDGAPAISRNFSNTYGVDTKVIDLSGLTIKDNTIRLAITNTTLQWDIDWLQVDTSADEPVTVTDLAPYYADLHFRGVSDQVPTNPSDKAMDITEPDYNHLAKTVGAANPLVGNATKFGDVTSLVSTVDDKFVVAVQGDELALKYHVPEQTSGTVRDFIYKTWDYHKSYHAPLGDQIGPLPFNAMTQYPYHENVEHYPTDIDHTNYESTYNTREINWGVVNSDPGLHHSLNTDFIQLNIDSTVYGVSARPATTSATIEWNTNVSASSQVYFGLNTSYGFSTDVFDTSPRVTAHSVSLSNLAPCSTYHYYVESVRTNEAISSSTDRMFTTLGCSGGAIPISIVSQTAATSTGVTATSTQSGTGITVVIPPGFSSTTSSVEVQIKSLDGSVTVGTLGTPPSVNSVGLVVFDVKALIDQTTTLDSFDLPVTITMSYSDVTGINQSTLWVYHYHNGAWQRLDSCVVDTGAHTITCTTPNFSVFGLFGQPSANQVASTGGTQTGGGGGSIYGCTDRNATNYSAGVVSNSSLCRYSTAIAPASNVTPASSVENMVSSPKILSKSVFTRNLYKGMKGKDVVELQKYLIAQNAGPFAKKLAKNGTSTFFGALTESTLKEFQKMNKILPATGAFGPKTRMWVNK